MDWNQIDYITQVITTSFSYAEVLDRLNLKKFELYRQRLKAFIGENSIDISHFEIGTTSRLWRSMTKEKLADIVSTSTTKTEICIKLGLSTRGSTYSTVAKYITRYNINTDHFQPLTTRNKQTRSTKRIQTDLLFTTNRPYNPSIKKRVLDEQLISYECYICKNDGHWNNKSLVLQLDHKNGDPTDNRLDNLQFLCPNCHSQTHNWGRKKR